MIQGLCGGGVKALAPRFTRTDIRAGQRHSCRPSDVVALPPLATLTTAASTPFAGGVAALGSTT